MCPRACDPLRPLRWSPDATQPLVAGCIESQGMRSWAATGAPPRVAHNDAEFQLRVAFFGLLEPKERVKILDSRREFLEGLLDHLRAVGPEAEDIVEFQRSAVEHELAWISGLAEEVRRD
jgi:hypothetical protein